VAVYFAPITLRRFCAIILFAELVLSCSYKSPSKATSSCPAGLSNPSAILDFARTNRHSNSACVATLLEKAYLKPEVGTPASLLWKFRLFYAALLLDKADDKDIPTVTDLITSPIPSDVPPGEAAARIASLQGYLAQYQSKWPSAEESDQSALASISSVDDPCWRAELLVHQLAPVSRHLNAKFEQVTRYLEQARPDTKACPDKYWETYLPFVQGNTDNDQFHYYEEAADSFSKCLLLADTNKLPELTGLCLGSLALSYYNLGDNEDALLTFDKVDAYYKNRPQPLTKKQLRYWGRDKGRRARTYLALKKYKEAAALYQDAIKVATETADSDFLGRWRAELTSLYIEEGDYRTAEQFNKQALEVTFLHDEFTSITAHLNEARIARPRGDFATALKELDEPQHFEIGKSTDLKLVWQFHEEFAEIFSATKKVNRARQEFATALRISESARATIKADDNRLTYFPQLRSLYQNYVDFLAAQNKGDEALRIAELGRARILSEKLSILPAKGASLDFTAIARAKNAVILSYSISPLHSYGWLTTSHRTQIFSLPPEAELEKLITHHNKQISKEHGIDSDEGGGELYKHLILPVATSIPRGGRVIVIPDGPLADLNFETLIPPGTGEPHYWIESAVVTVAPALTLLSTNEQKAIYPASLLLVGNADQVDQKLPVLDRREIAFISNLYPGKCRILERAQATPSQILQNNPASFALIHFSAHAIPNLQSPLDSYIALSPEAGGEYRLYAHDFRKLRLQANLVTLSACQSAGANVPGEGLVGLTWAVLSAGAKSVVASLWPVAYRPTSTLMEKFYLNLHEGQPPAQALHKAKLQMIRDPKIKASPFEWAAFQLYSR